MEEYGYLKGSRDIVVVKFSNPESFQTTIDTEELDRMEDYGKVLLLEDKEVQVQLARTCRQLSKILKMAL